MSAKWKRSDGGTRRIKICIFYEFFILWLWNLTVIQYIMIIAFYGKF